MSVTICEGCGATFNPSGRRRFCSDACRQAAWRYRNTIAVAPTKLARHTIVYACPDCQARYIGTQRCPDCNTFCTRLGIGAPCPHCDEPVAISDLLPDTTE
jgi:hypothetical protein